MERVKISPSPPDGRTIFFPPDVDNFQLYFQFFSDSFRARKSAMCDSLLGSLLSQPLYYLSKLLYWSHIYIKGFLPYERDIEQLDNRASLILIKMSKRLKILKIFIQLLLFIDLSS